MSKHTPGPWTFRNGRSVHSAEKSIALCQTGLARKSVPSPDECMANARLIAAAPELLEELKRALYVLETVARNDGYDTEVGIVPTVRAVIAKATGSETPDSGETEDRR